MKKLIFLLTAIFILIIFYFMNSNTFKSLYNEGTAVLAGQTVNLDISKTLDEKTLGLSGRDQLEEDEGMWFVYDEPKELSFWMKNMKFPIDIIWIRSGEVVDFSIDAKPEPGVKDADLKRYWPRVAADTVLEVRSGWVRAHGVKIGDTVDFRENF